MPVYTSTWCSSYEHTCIILNTRWNNPRSPIFVMYSTVPCSKVNVNNVCTSNNARCLVQNKTRETKCVDSCYLGNGGCGSDRICFNKVNDDCKSGNSLADCETHVECLGLNGEFCMGYWYCVTGSVLLVLGYWYCVTGTGLLVLCYWYWVTGTVLLEILCYWWFYFSDI